MKVNYKQLYAGLKQQHKILMNQANPVSNDVEKVNEIPENFNQVGWDITIEKVELMVSKMKQLRDVKGKRLTPQFYRSIYNRALIACGEADKLFESLTAENEDIDYEFEVMKLNAEIVSLQTQIAESAKLAEEAAKIAEEAEKAKQEKSAEKVK